MPTSFVNARIGVLSVEVGIKKLCVVNYVKFWAKFQINKTGKKVVPSSTEVT